MNRNQVAAAADLQTGDRFYKLGDPKKEVLQCVLSPVYTTAKRSKIHYVKAALIDKGFHADKLKNYAMSMAAETQIVYLRNVNNDEL